MNDQYKDEVLVRYLLGELPEEEQTRLEELFFSDDQLYEHLLALEDELRYDHAQGKLSGIARERFEERFLVSPGDRARSAFAERLLDKLADRRSKAGAEPVARARRSGGFKSFLGLFAFQNAAVGLALTAAALVMMLGGGGLIYETMKLRSQIGQLQAQNASEEDRLRLQTEEERRRVAELGSELDRERSERQRLEQELAAQHGGQGGALAAIVTFIISPGGVRGEGPVRRDLRLPKEAQTVQLQLKLNKKALYQSYRASLLTAEGNEIWSGNVRRAGSGSPTLIIKLPARILSNGDYELSLKGQTKQNDFEEADSYYFTVLKK